MSNLNDFYRQKGLNELKGKVDSNRFLTTEQREMIHQIIDEEMDNDVKDKLRSMTDKQKRALKRKLSGQNEEVELDEGVKLTNTAYDLDQMVLTFDVNGTKQQFVYWDYDENWKNTKSKDVLDQLSKEKWYNSLDNSTKKKVLDSATKSIRSEGVHKEEVEEEMDNDVKDKLKKMTDSQKRALKRKLSDQNEEVELDEIAMANTEYSRAHNSAKDLTKKAHASGKSDHFVAAIQAHKKALKYAKSSTNKAAHTGHIRDLSKKMAMAESVELDENLSFAEKQEALIKFGYDPTNVRYMNGDILEQAYESMINILNAQNPTLAAPKDYSMNEGKVTKGNGVTKFDDFRDFESFCIQRGYKMKKKDNVTIANKGSEFMGSFDHNKNSGELM